MTKKIWELIKQYIDERIDEKIIEHDMDYIGNTWHLDSEIERLIEQGQKND